MVARKAVVTWETVAADERLTGHDQMRKNLADLMTR